ncbi:MAG TPA: hypothetical protein VF997_12025 [Polyangia bacterium]
MRTAALALALCLLAPAARASEAPASATSPTEAPTTIAAPAPKPAGKLLVYTSFAFNVYTYLGAQGMSPATNLTPDNRAIIYQQLGFGYFVHPKLRLTLTLQFGETLTGLPNGASHFSLLGIIPWLVFTHKGFFTGAGPVLAPISYGKVPNFDAGIYTATGYSFKLGRGLSLAPALQAVLMLNQRVSFALTPTVALAYRF